MRASLISSALGRKWMQRSGSGSSVQKYLNHARCRFTPAAQLVGERYGSVQAKGPSGKTRLATRSRIRRFESSGITPISITVLRRHEQCFFVACEAPGKVFRILWLRRIVRYVSARFFTVRVSFRDPKSVYLYMTKKATAPPPKYPPVMRAAQAADYLSISPQRLYARIREGTIPQGVYVRLGRSIRVVKAELDRWLAEGGCGLD